MGTGAKAGAGDGRKSTQEFPKYPRIEEPDSETTGSENPEYDPLWA